MEDIHGCRRVYAKVRAAADVSGVGADKAVAAHDNTVSVFDDQIGADDPVKCVVFNNDVPVAMLPLP